MEYTIETRCLHLEEEKNKDKDFGSVSFPIYHMMITLRAPTRSFIS